MLGAQDRLNGAIPASTPLGYWAAYISRKVDGFESSGPAGYLYVRTSAALEWIVNHNLVRLYPSVAICDQAGAVLNAEVEHQSENQVRIRFTVPMTGYARVQ